MEENILPPHKEYTYTRNKRTIFYIEMGILCAAIFARNILEIPISVVLILAVASLIALDNRRNEIIALCICCIPMATAFQYKYLLLACILIYALKYYRDIRITWRIFPLLCMLIWEILHGFHYTFSLYEVFRIFSELIFCSFLITLDYKKTNYVMICRMLAIVSVFMVSVVLLNLLKANDFNFSLIFLGSYRLGIGNAAVKEFGVNYNANQLGFICNLSISGLLQLILTKNQRKTDYVLIVALCLFGIMTMSRTFLVCLAVLLVMFISFGEVRKSVKIKRIFLVGLVCALIALFAYILMPSVFTSFVARFFEEDVSNGRAELFRFYNEHLLSDVRYLFFGVGIQNFARELVNIYGTISNVCHNGIQEILVCWGIPGLFMMTVFLLSMIFDGKVNFKRRKFNYMPLVLIMVYIQAGQFVQNGTALLALSFAYLSLQWNSNDSAEGIEK
ncbi:MAG: hypothetical protein IKY52_10080 [Clostridia bacterium]|nr:hypothetical protein [Clostridia bacterium]